MLVKPEIQKKKKTISTISVFFTIALICSFFLYKNIPGDINTDVKAHSSPSESINHANTYYWYSRAKGTTLYELDKAILLAKDAEKKARSGFPKLSAEERDQINKKANSIVSLSLLNKNLYDLNINNRIPFFLEMTGNDAFREEDQSTDEMNKVATTRSLDNLLSLNSTEGSVPLGSKPFFSFVIHNTNDKKLEEAAIQYLNLKSKHYIISKHELSQYSGILNPSATKLKNDTNFLRNLCANFNTTKIGFFEITKYDEVDGIYYYGGRFCIWSLKESKVVDSIYTETLVKDRTYNVVTILKLPLFILMLSLLVIIGIAGVHFLKGTKSINWTHFLLYGFIAFVSSIVLIELVTNFLSPASGEFHEADEVEIWRYAMALSLTLLPLLITYIIAGKLDNMIEKYNSALDEAGGLYSVLLPSFISLPLALGYYSILRFGFSYHLLFVLAALICTSIYAFLIAAIWKESKDFPEELSPIKKTRILSALLITVIACLMFAYNIIGFWNFENTIFTIVTFSVIPCSIAFVLYKVKYFDNKFHSKEENNKKSQIHFIKPPKFEKRVQFFEAYGLLYIVGQEGAGKSREIDEILEAVKASDTEVYKIDLMDVRGEDESHIHYYPFANGLKDVLPFKKFNDKAEEAKQVGNILGKLLNAITSAGSLLVDEGKAKAADPKKLGEQIISAIRKNKNSILVIDNIHLLEGENAELFTHLMTQLTEELKESNRNKSQSDSHEIKIIYTSNPYFAFKNNLAELTGKYIIEKHKIGKGYNSGLINEIDLSKPPINLAMELREKFFEIGIHKKYLEEYLKTYRFRISDRLKLIKCFVDEEKNNNPGVISATMIELKRLGQLKVEKDIIELNNFKELPDITPSLKGFTEHLTRLNEDLKRILRTCAYCAISSGEFQVEAICDIMKKDRLEVLNSLKICEKENIITDIRTEYDWYKFNDLRFVNVLKEMDAKGSHKDELSQFGKEVYKRFIKYYHPKLNTVNLKDGKNIEIIELIAERSFNIYEENPSETISINKKCSEIFLRKEIAKLSESEKFYRHCLLILQKYPELNINNLDKQIIIEGLLNSLMEENKLNEAWDEILKNDKSLYGISEQLDKIFDFQLLTWRVRTFNPGDPENIEKGKNLCQSLTEREKNLKDKVQLSPSEKLRVKWYELLFIQKGGKNLDDLEALKRKFIIIGDSIINEKSRIALLEKDADNKNDLYLLDLLEGEYLNNLGGLFADNIIGLKELSFNPNLKKEKFDEGKKFLEKRLLLELRKINIHEFDKTRISELTVEKNKFSTDRRGLCYTFNYLTRLYYSMELFEEALAYSELAIVANEEAGDQRGNIMAHSFCGQIHEKNGRYEEAFEHFESAFTHANPEEVTKKNLYQINLAIENIKRIAIHLSGEMKERSKEYLNFVLISKVEIKHLIRHFQRLPDDYIEYLIKNGWMESEKEIKDNLNSTGSKFNYEFVRTPHDLMTLIKGRILKENLNNVKKDSFCSSYLECKMPSPVGHLSIIPLIEIPNEQIKDIIQVERFGNEVLEISLDRLTLTNQMTIIFNNPELTEIRTVFPGTWSPPFPNKQKQTEEQFAIAEKFWSEHAFIKTKT